MPYSDEEEHSPSEFYCPGATNGSNAIRFKAKITLNKTTKV